MYHAVYQDLASRGGRSLLIYPCGKADMKNPEQTLRTDTWTAEGVFRAIVLLILWSRTTIVLSGVAVGVRSYFLPTFPALGENAALDMVAAYSPRLYTMSLWWELATPEAAMVRGTVRAWWQEDEAIIQPSKETMLTAIWYAQMAIFYSRPMEKNRTVFLKETTIVRPSSYLHS